MPSARYIVYLAVLIPSTLWSTYRCARYIHQIQDSYMALNMRVDSIPICERQYCVHNNTITSVLFAIRSPAFAVSIQRRNIIRNTFVRQINEYPQASYTFYLSRPDDENALVIYNESIIHKDMTILTAIPENWETGVTQKTFEFLKSMQHTYDWVCHTDDDSYLQIYRLMEQYILNRHFPPFRTVISRVRVEPEYLHEKEFPYPGEQFYCLSRDIAKAIATLHELGNNSLPADGVSIGLFIRRTFGQVRWVDLLNPIAYDIGISRNINDYAHVANPKQGINPHKMKENAQYETVALAHMQTYINSQ